MDWIGSAGILGSTVVLTHGAWWTLLNCVAIRPPAIPQTVAGGLSFAVIVPAHNEAGLIARCIASLQHDDWIPAPRIIVVADNCKDDTAALARSMDVEVVERVDPLRRGKSYALQAGIAHIRESGTTPEIAVFVDGDTFVDPGFFAAHAARFARGASATQAFYCAEPGRTSLGRLRSLALRLAHWGRPLGAARLGLGSGIKGSGMAVRWSQVPALMRAHGLAEDAAMTLELARDGIAVTFVPGARVTGPFAQDYDDARTQDDRWERGRLSLMSRAVLAAVGALTRGRVGAAAGAADVATLPLSLLAGLTVMSLTLAAAAGSMGGLILGAGAAVSLVAYVASGILAARPPRSEVSALATAPRFLAYKAAVYGRLLTRRAQTWQRTRRDGDVTAPR